MNVQEYFRRKRELEADAPSFSHHQMLVVAHNDSADSDNPDLVGFYIHDGNDRRVNLSLWEMIELVQWALKVTEGCAHPPLANKNQVPEEASHET